MIYFDQSEGRVGSRLPKDLLKYAQPCIGLEAQTGADLLISPLDTFLPENVNRPPGSLILRKHTEAGMLIQRKSGNDMLGSIPHLGSILQRMQQWDSICWLLVCGKFTPSEKEEVIVDARTSGWQWVSYAGAKDAWCLRGGLIHEEPDDDHGAYWLNRMDENIGKLRKDAIVLPPVQKIAGGMFDQNPWRITLMSFPGCGEELSRRIAGYTGNLATALWYMSDVNSNRLPGVGIKLKEQWNRYLGLKPGDALIPFDANDNVVPRPYTDIDDKAIEAMLTGKEKLAA